MTNPLETPSRDSEILVTGSLAFDQIMDFPGFFKDHVLPDKLHMINLSFLVRELRKQRGGCAGNVAYSLALLGERARVVAAAGQDFAEYREFLVGLGVDVDPIAVDPKQVTACCFITTDRANNQITGFFPGAMSGARELSLASAVTPRTRYAIVMPDDPEAMLRHCREAKAAGVPLLFDPSFQVIALDGAALTEAARGAYAVLVNDYEYAVFQEKSGLDDRGLLELAEIWVVTRGEEGSRILTRGGETLEVPAVPAGEVVDPTGAGDAYRAGFLTGLVRGCDLATCGRLGSVAAVYAIESYGTQNHGYERDEFFARYRAHFG
ncbi:MAG: carbohydrate kinase family protein [Thermoanaerobaculia bacterium]|nr:carbohydrate kinase family protein [Thermoanaerobaculia bacterium]